MSGAFERTKAQAIFFLLGAVLVGGALGFSAHRALQRGEVPKSQRSSRTQLADRLDLDNGQRRMLDSVLDDRNARMQALLLPVQPQLDSLRLAARAVIRARLNGTQQRRWDDVMLEQSRDSLRGYGR